METKEKKCYVCGVIFQTASAKSKCQKCQSEYLRVWKLAHPEKVAAYNINYQKNNSDYIRQYKKEYRAAHPEQARESLREWKKRNPEKVLADGRKQDAKRAKTKARKEFMKAQQLKMKFDISLETYKTLLEIQRGLCAICGKEETHLSRDGSVRQLCVDHDHKTGKVRQLLCNRCNAMLGRAQDDIERLSSAIEYLKKHSK